MILRGIVSVWREKRLEDFHLDKARRRQFQCISPFFTIMKFLNPKFKSFNLQMGEDVKQ